MKRVLACLCIVMLVVGLFGCAAGTNSFVGTSREAQPQAAAEPKPAGFWMGLWHGIITPVTFVISLFSRATQIYEVHNNGGWYDFGFLLGVSMIFGGGGGGAARASRRRD
jgi:hypothetical protein